MWFVNVKGMHLHIDGRVYMLIINDYNNNKNNVITEVRLRFSISGI